MEVIEGRKIQLLSEAIHSPGESRPLGEEIKLKSENSDEVHEGIAPKREKGQEIEGLKKKIYTSKRQVA